MTVLKNIWQGWARFWFSPVPLINLALFRFFLCATMFLMYLSRQKDLDLFFSEQGILPKALALKSLPEFFRPLIILSFWPDSWIAGVHIIFLLSLLLFALGLGGRAVGFLAAFLHLAFLQRNYGVAFGADQIGGIFLLYLAFTEAGDRLSVQNFCKGKKSRAESAKSSTAVFYRLIQVQLCIIYIYTGFEKLKGSSWWDGTALWSVFANPQMVITDLTWLKEIPLVIPVISFLTILFEIYFTPLVWNLKTRKFILAAGFFFHLGIGLSMALFGFAAIMLTPYLLFMSPQALDKSLRRWDVSI